MPSVFSTLATPPPPPPPQSITIVLTTMNSLCITMIVSRAFGHQGYCTLLLHKRQRKALLRQTHHHYQAILQTATMGVINFDASSSAPTSTPPCPWGCSNANSCHPILLGLGFLYIFLLLIMLFGYTGQRRWSTEHSSQGVDCKPDCKP